MNNIKHISIAASKSYLQRALTIASLSKGKSVLNQVSWCNDSLATKNIIEDLGSQVQEKDSQLIIHSEGLNLKNTYFNAEESGLSLRMFSPILALSNKLIHFIGNGSLKTRPMNLIIDALSMLNVDIKSNDGFLPLEIKGPIRAGNIEIDGSLSSQLLTGLLIALPLVKGDSTIKVKNLKSKPYIDMTLSIMAHFGVVAEHNNYEIFKIKGNQKYKGYNYDIEGDWSSGAFFLVYGAVNRGLEIQNLNITSAQADTAIVKALELAGAKITQLEKGIRVEKNQLNAFNFDATDCPDLFPPLVCLASQCKGTSKIKGISRLKHKESNRAEILKQEFAKMSITISLEKDDMLITGGNLKSCIIDSHNDHRIAMVGGIMNLLSDVEIKVINKEAVNKSYPQFFEDLEYLK